jgi:hypothetical protein
MMPTATSVPHADAANRAQEQRVGAFQHERPEQQRENNKRQAGDRAEQDERRVVECEHRAEQHMHQIDVAAAGRHDQHPERKRDQVEGGEARILAQNGRAGNEPGEQRDGEPGDQPADRHGAERKSGDEKAAGWRAPWRRRSGSCAAA